MKDEAHHLRRNEAKWDRWAGWLDDERRSRHLRQDQGTVISLLKLPPDVHFLDVGCGTGWAVGRAAELAPARGLFYGVDLSARMIEKAQSNFRGRSDFRFMQANSEAIPLEDDYFDAIICTNSFHHYRNPSKALSEMHRLLKVGGKTFILDPTADSWVAKLADAVIRLAEPEHVKMYSTVEFRALFEAAGFKYSAVRAPSWHHGIHIGEK